MVCSLDKLSVELRQAIFFCLPDLEDIQSLALSCSSLYLAYIAHKGLIQSQVLRNSLYYDVLPEAAAALESNLVQPHKQDDLDEFSKKHLLSRIEPNSQFISRNVLSMYEFSGHVQYLATDFVARSLAQSPGQTDKEQTAPSDEEMARIQRAFYRFEIYCNLYRNHNRNSIEVDFKDQQKLFFSKFSLLENEQLVCVHDYLANAILPAFNEVAEHDVGWGALRIEYDVEMDSGYIQYALSMGLSTLHQIIVAKSYAERHRLLCTCTLTARGYNPGKYYPGINRDFLFESLLRATNIGGVNGYLRTYPSDDNPRFTQAPFFTDLDTGPESCWRWGNAYQASLGCANWTCLTALRRWGYVMWDSTRLGKWKIFEEALNPYDSPIFLPSQEEIDAETRRLADMHASFLERDRIRLKGGVGYWSRGDESKVVYPPWDEIYGLCPVNPRSLDEAKKLILSLNLPVGSSRPTPPRTT